MPGTLQTLPVPPPVSVPTLLNAIRLAASSGGSSSVAFADITGAPGDNAALAAALAAKLDKAGGTMTGTLTLASNVHFTWAGDLLLYRAAAASLQLGTNHATTATAQTIKAHNVTTGNGANLILAGGTGSGAQGQVLLKGSSVEVWAPNGFLSLDATGGNYTPISGSVIGSFSRYLQWINVADMNTYADAGYEVMVQDLDTPQTANYVMVGGAGGSYKAKFIYTASSQWMCTAVLD